MNQKTIWKLNGVLFTFSGIIFAVNGLLEEQFANYALAATFISMGAYSFLRVKKFRSE